MKIKYFNGYARYSPYRNSIEEAVAKVNEFIEDKNVIDIKIAGTQCEYGHEMFQYVVIYKEETK